MSGETSQKAPIEINNVKIQRLKNWVDGFLKIEDDDGVLDIDRAMRNINHSASTFYSNLNGIMMQESFKLSEIEADLNRIKAHQYDKVKRFTDYQVDSNGIRILVDGNEDVIKKQVEYDKQKQYISYLDRTMKQFDYFAKKVEVMLKAREWKDRYGGFE